MSAIKLVTPSGGSVSLVPENTAVDNTVIVPKDPIATKPEVAQVYTDLSGSGGAGLVGYQPDGTGAVATTVQDKLRSRELADYSALRAFAGTETTVEIVGAGIAGLFNYDASDTTSEDNGGTIIVDAVGRRFKRVFDGSKADAVWFEVDSSGVSDCTSRAQAALTAVDEVVFNGSFLVSTTLVTRAKNRVTTNSGALFSIKSGVSGFDVFQITTSDVVIAGISFNLNKSSVTSDAGSAVSVVSTGDLKDIKIYKNTIIDGSKYGIYVSGPSVAGKHADLKKIGIEIYGNEVSGCKSQGILIRNCHGFKFYENEVSYCGGTTMDGVQIGLYKNAVIRSNKAYSNGRHGITLEYGLNFQATENQCWNNANGGLVIGGGEATWDAAKNYVISENICWGNVGPGIQVDPGLSGQTNIPVVSPATIEGNVTYSNGGHGIYCQNVRDQTVAGNTSHSNTLDGVAVNGYACQIAGNTCTRNRFGVNAQASYAVWSAGAAFAVNAVVIPSTQNGFAFKATVAGTSGGTEPGWPTTLGETVSDGGVTWQAIEQYGYHSIGENTLYENVLGDRSVSAQAWRVKNSANSILSDPGAIASMGSIQVTVTCNGATPGQLAKAWFGVPVGGLLIFAEVSAKNKVLVTLFNPTASSINPTLSRLYVSVEN